MSVKAALESVYGCLCITCEDVGALIEATDDTAFGAACITSPGTTASSTIKFGPSKEHSMHCSYTYNGQGNFDMASTGCTFS